MGVTPRGKYRHLPREMQVALTELARFILVILLNHTVPGGSIYSMQTLPECGTDEHAPTCEMARVCDGASPLCAPPRWSESRSAWVRVESREAAALRLRNAAIALAKAAEYLASCHRDGVADEACRPLSWPRGTRDLAMAMLAKSIWESGYREDIMRGAPPAGRGADGEACVMQIMPAYIREHALWLSPEERVSRSDEELAQQQIGRAHV